MKKKIIVACGGAVATSTIAARKIMELCQRHNIPADICQVRISEIESNLSGASLIVTTSRIKRDYGIPLITGTSFISGVGIQKTEDNILEIVKK